MSFFTLLITSTFTTQIQLVYAGGKSPYESGRDYGCDDADLSPSDRYINEPGKGPSNHTPEFMSGYRDGFQECGGGSSDGGDDTDSSNDDGNAGSSDSRSRSDVVQDFCSALGRGDLAEAEGLLALTPYRSLAVAARVFCGIVSLTE